MKAKTVPDRNDELSAPAASIRQKDFLTECLNTSLHDHWSNADCRGHFPENWQGMESLAEYHSVAPLVYREIQINQIPIPDRLRRQFRALFLRHRRANLIRFHCLAEIADLFEEKGISLLVLKGAALAHLLYDEEFLRPMRDLDLLVPADRLAEAAVLLEALGYESPHGLHRFNHWPHHLPTCQKVVQGLTVSVELHRDAMSRNAHHSLTMADQTGPPQSFVCAGRSMRAFNHVDMLRHLCVHSFSPSGSGELRLIHLYDIMAYVTKFADRIDWQRLTKEYPYVINAIRCVHFVLPCPPAVARQVGPPSCKAPPGCGKAIRPLSGIFRRNRSLAALVKELLCPSPWWMHAYYGVSPEASLLPCHLWSHPAEVCRWLWLRLISVCHAELTERKSAAANPLKNRIKP